MGIESFISWTDGTVNFWWGCTEVAPECAFCYAKLWSKRTGKADWGRDGTRQLVKGAEAIVRGLARNAAECGHKQIAFVSSMCDIFETDDTFDGQWLNHRGEKIAMTFDQQRARAFAAIDSNPNVHFLLLTKRIENVADLTPANPNPISGKASQFRANVSFGTSAGTQKTWDDKMQYLMGVRDICPSTFVSCEPLLEPVVPRPVDGCVPDVVFVGGESAAKEKVRAMDLRWALDIKAAADSFGCIFHFKQLGVAATLDGEPMKYNHPKGEDPSEWPVELKNCQSLPGHWRAPLAA